MVIDVACSNSQGLASQTNRSASVGSTVLSWMVWGLEVLSVVWSLLLASSESLSLLSVHHASSEVVVWLESSLRSVSAELWSLGVLIGSLLSLLSISLVRKVSLGSPSEVIPSFWLEVASWSAVSLLLRSWQVGSSWSLIKIGTSLVLIPRFLEARSLLLDGALLDTGLLFSWASFLTLRSFLVIGWLEGLLLWRSSLFLLSLNGF